MKQPPSRIAGKVCVGNLGGNCNMDKKISQATGHKLMLIFSLQGQYFVKESIA